MPSPIAHGGAALALRLLFFSPLAAAVPRSRARPGALDRVLLAAAFASVAPDLDLIGGVGWHRGPTHSLVGATLLGGLCALAARLRGADALVVVLACVLHVPMDWSTGDPGAPVRYGVPWAWPFSSAKAISPQPWFGAYHIDEPGFLAQMLDPRAVPVYAKEVGTAAAMVAAAAVARAFRGSWPRRTRDRAP